MIPWVFCRSDGKLIRDYYTAWREACQAAGIDRIRHDFRRTAVRNFERAGVPRTTAMAMVGHKTESICRRYSIVDQAMLEVGASKLDQLQRAQRVSKPVVVSIKRSQRSDRSLRARFPSCLLTLVVAFVFLGSSLVSVSPLQSQSTVFPGKDWESMAPPESAGYSSQRLAALNARLGSIDTTTMMVGGGGRSLFTYGDLTHLSYLASGRKSCR